MEIIYYSLMRKAHTLSFHVTDIIILEDKTNDSAVEDSQIRRSNSQTASFGSPA